VASKLISAIILIAIGTVLVLPIEAKVSKKAVTVKWLNKTYYTKKQANKRYYKKTSVDSKLGSYYTKTDTDSKLDTYYTKTNIDNLLANYLTSTNAASTYLTQSNAANTYLTPTTGDSSYINASGDDTMSGTLTASNFSYSSSKTKYLNIPGAAFRPEGSAQILTTTASVGGEIYSNTAGSVYVYAPVYLPDNAVITAFRFYYYDNSVGANINAYLTKMPIGSSTSEFLAYNYSPTDSPTIAFSDEFTSYLPQTIDNQNNTYFVRVLFGTNSSDLRLRMGRITYTVSNP